MHKLILLLITCQLIGISGLILYISQKKEDVSKSIVKLDSKEYITSPSIENPFFYEPVAGKVISEKMPGMNASYRINEDSLHDRFNYSLEKPEKSYRIVTLGDSFVFGQFVDTRNNWTELLEDKLNADLRCSDISKFEVINLGVGGYDRAYAIERFRKRGQKYNADAVIWLDAELFRNAGIVGEKLRDFETKIIHSGQPITGSNYEDLKNRLFKQIEDEMLTGEYKRKEQERIELLVSSIRDYFKGPVFLLAVPSASPTDRDVLKLIAQENENMYFYDGIRNIYDIGAYFESDGHPNEKGHKVLAEDIFEYYKEFLKASCI